MPSDTFYGSDCELRIGLMADAATDPTTWHKLEFIRATFSPSRDRRPRPKLGAPRHNPLDPIKPIDGFLRLGADIVVDGDTRQFARWLRCLLGAPTTTGSGPTYTHKWVSGGTSAQLCAIQLKTGATEIRIYRGLTLGAIALQVGGEQVEDFDIQLSLRGLSYARAADWLTGTTSAVPAAAPARRAVFRADAAAASNTLSASWSYDRGLTEDAFLSPLAELSGLRPGESAVSGQANFRAVGAAFDTLEEGGTLFAADVQLLGKVASHEIRFAHPLAQLNAPPLAINGPGLVERTFSWIAHQDEDTPAAEVVVVNDVASLAA